MYPESLHAVRWYQSRSKWPEKPFRPWSTASSVASKLHAASQLCSAGHPKTIVDNKAQLSHQLLLSKLKWAVHEAGRWESMKSHWRRHLYSATQIAVGCQKTITAGKGASNRCVQCCGIIRDGELVSRKILRLPISKGARRGGLEASGASLASFRTLARELALGFMWLFVSVTFS